jgi:cell division protein FtsB
LNKVYQIVCLILLFISAILFVTNSNLKDKVNRVNETNLRLEEENRILESKNISLQTKVSSQTAEIDTLNQEYQSLTVVN